MTAMVIELVPGVPSVGTAATSQAVSASQGLGLAMCRCRGLVLLAGERGYDLVSGESNAQIRRESPSK